MIALMCDSSATELCALLSAFDKTKTFQSRGSLLDYIAGGGKVRLAVVAQDGVKGMNAARYSSRVAPVLWVTQQAGFLNESKRIGAVGFLVKPVFNTVLCETVERLIIGES